MPHFPPGSLKQVNALSITEGDLLQKLAQLNISKTAGPDKLHAWILKEGCFGLCKPLLMLFNLSLKCAPQSGNRPLLH